MEQGWILDSGHSSSFQSAWVEGDPKSSTLGFLTGGKSARGKKRRAIDSFRCTKCGYLELYAIREEKIRMG